MRRALLLLVLVLAAFAAATIHLFILQEDYVLPRADAVIVLAGDKRRLPAAQALVERGVAPVLVISDGLDSKWWAANRLCRWGENVLCPRPDPYSTRGEARLIGRLASERGWDEIVVVTSRFHLYRARLLVERCYHGRLGVVGSDYSKWRLPLQLSLEWLKLARAEVARRC
jgi:uncharacterized SAM-binding protein YcdF (DUF218 family)